jgi:MFS family permease
MYSQQGYLIPLDLSELYGDQGAVIYGTMSSLNCIVVVIFTPLWTKWLRTKGEVEKMILGTAFFFAGLLVFTLGMRYRILYYLAVVIYTWGEILHSLSGDPYLTRRVPLTHRGRILGINSVMQSIVYGLFQIGIGQWYVKLGSLHTWMIVLGILLGAVGLGFILLKQDRETYPQLYAGKEDL